MMKCLSLFLVLTLFTFSSFAQEDQPKVVTYKDGDVTLEGYWSPSKCYGRGAQPIVLIVHQWKGITDHERQVADKVGELCYNALAVDIYGQGVRPKTVEEAKAESGKYKEKPELAARRLKAAIEFAKKQPNVDAGRIAAMGYCFGGGLVLDLARSNADIQGVVSFHGNLNTSMKMSGAPKASILVHHGADDPFVPASDVTAFVTEMTSAKADWVLSQYAGAVHSFTQKGIEADKIEGAAYNEKADNRSWSATTEFLMEVLSRQ
jgi:dienelactone hydrolase